MINGFALREMAEDDLEMVLAWRNLEMVRANMYTDHVISLEEHRKWFAHAKQDPKTVYLICERHGIPIGVVNFVEIDRKNNKAYWGFYLGDEEGPRGRGSAMEFLALEYAFDVLNLHKLCAEVFSFNQPVIRLHSKFGFKAEGCFRRHILKNGQYEDIVPIALFREEWKENRDRMKIICFRTRDRS